MSCFWYSYKGNEVQTKYTPKYYTFDDYLGNYDKAKVLKKQPEGDYLLAPGTATKLTKPEKYLFILKDDGLISDTPVSAFCVIITE